MAKVLVIDDEQGIRNLLDTHMGFSCSQVRSSFTDWGHMLPDIRARVNGPPPRPPFMLGAWPTA